MSLNPAFPDYCIFCDQLIQQNKTPTTSLTCATAMASVGLNSKQKTLYCSTECFHRDQMLKNTNHDEKTLTKQSCKHDPSNCISALCNGSNNTSNTNEDNIGNINEDNSENNNENGNYNNLQMLSPISYNGDFVNNNNSNTRDCFDLQDDFFQLDQDYNASHYSAVPSATVASTDYGNSGDSESREMGSHSHNTQFHVPSPSLQFDNTPSISKYVSLFDQSHQIFCKGALNQKRNYKQELNDGICENNYKIWLNENHIWDYTVFCKWHPFLNKNSLIKVQTKIKINYRVARKK